MTKALPLRPSPLAEGSVVRIVAPAGPFPRPRLERGIAVLEKRGYVVRHRDDLFDTRRYLAGEDARRIAELQEALDDPETDAVWAARGGYGTMRLLPSLDLSALLARPKVVVGFSDITALHAVLTQGGLVSFHGPVACRLGEEPDEALDLLWRMIASTDVPGPLMWEPLTTIRPGRVAGPLVGGNLAVLTRLLGTPYLPDLDGAILLLEDVAERPYRLDRMLTHLELAGVPERLAGVLVGELVGCEENGADYTAADVVAERIAEWNVPAAMGFPSGHGERNFTLPLAWPLTLDAAVGRLDWSLPPVASPATAAA